MNYDPWNLNIRRSRFSKFLPALLKDKIVQCAVLMLFVASIDWQLSVRMSDQQYYFLYLYLWAHICMYIGFDPTGYITVGFHDGQVDVTRIGIATDQYFVGAWSRYCDGITRGFSIAFFFTALAVAYSIASKSVEKWAQKERQTLDEIDRQIAFEKQQQELYRLENLKRVPPEPVQPLEAGRSNQFESPEVASLTELIDEQEVDDIVPEPPPEETPVIVPLRQPGRIYR